MTTVASCESAVRQHQALTDGFVSRVLLHPDAPCLTYGDETFSYAELWSAAQRVSSVLSGLGVRPGDRVVIHAPRDAGFVIVMLGVLNLGACYVPMDTATPRSRMEIVLGEVRAALVVGETGYDGYGECRVVIASELLSDVDRHAGPDPQVHRATTDSLAYIIYTSGSTGRPKGVEVSHEMVANLLAHTVDRLGLGPDDVFTSTHSFAFDVSVWELWAGWWSGGHVIIVPREIARSGPALLELCCARGVTVVSQTPTAFDLLMTAFDLNPTAPSAIRYVVLAGEALDFDRVRAWRSRHGHGVPTPVNMYGITEITVHGTYLEVTDEVLERAGSRSLIGVPMAGNVIRVLTDDLAPATRGEAGEAYVSGPGVTRGYHARPAQTATRFVACIDGAAGEIMYRSGDRMRVLDDGSLEYLGRADDQVKINGFRVELGDVEAAIQALPQVRSVAVVANRQGGRTHLLAYVVAEFDALDRGAVRAALDADLPDYMRPHAIIELSEFPLTVNGKLDKAALPAPGRSDVVTAAVTSPRTALETQLCQIWTEVLGIGPIGIEDDFLELGGDSMAAHQVAVRLPEDIPGDPSAVLRCRTIASLARHLQSPDAAAVAVVRSGAQPGPLSPVQERFWFEQEADPHSSHLNVRAAFRVTGPLDGARLAEAMQDVIDRDDILRTRIVDGATGPHSVVRPRSAPGIPVRRLDLSGVSRADHETVWHEVMRRECSRPFDLRRDDPIRALLARVGPEEWGFALNVHHMVVDGWSLRELLAELGSSYRGVEPAVRGEYSYADYTAWHAAEPQRRRAESGLVRVIGSLRGHQPPAIPDWAAGSGDGRTEGCGRTIVLNEPETAAVHELAMASGHSAYVALMGCVGATLSWSLDVDDIVLATITSTRKRREWLDIIGPVIETLPVRIVRSDEMTLVDYIQAAGNSLLTAMDNDDVPFQAVVDSVRSETNHLRRPLAVAVVTMQQEWEALDLGVGVHVVAQRVPRSDVVAGLSIEFRPRGARMDVVVEYRSDTYSPAFVDLLIGRFESLIADVASHRSDLRLRDLLRPVGGEIAAAAGSESALGVGVRPRTVPDELDRLARHHPQAIAVSDAGGQISFEALQRRSIDIAVAVQKCWEKSSNDGERFVVVLLPRGVDFIAALLGAWYAGAAYVPVDPSSPTQRVTDILRSSRACAVITDHTLGPKVAGCAVPVVDIAHVTRQSPSPRVDELRGEVEPGGAAYVIYTSGSAGVPKGVVVSHDALAQLCAWHVSAFDVGPTDRAAHTAGLGFDAGAWEIWPALSAGARVDIPSARALGSMRELADWFTTRGTTITFVSTPLAELLLDEPNVFATRLRIVLTGGDTLTRRPPPGMTFRLVNNYGPTECTVVTTSGEVHAADSSNRLVSPGIGSVRAGLRAHVLDDELQRVPVGRRGELYVGGSGMARGYLDDPAQTATRFVADPFAGDGSRMYRTGDIVRPTPCGDLEFLGRADTQIKVRGNRVELGEVEAALNAVPGVARVAAIDVAAHDDVTLDAFVVPRSGAELDPTDVYDHLRRHLPDYMMPSAVVILDTLPLTPNGKVDRAALRSRSVASRRSGDSTAASPHEEIHSATTDVLAPLRAIFADVLNIPDVADDTNFFAAGGDSIKGLRVCAQAQRHGLSVVVRDLFQWQTPAELARHVMSVVDEPRRAHRPVDLREGPLLPAQHLLMTELASADVNALACFHQVIRVPVPLSVEEGALRTALRAVVGRHDALHTGVAPRSGRPRQHLASADVGDLLQMATSADDTWVLGPMDIAAGEMVRARLSHDEPKAHLTIAIHHLAVDAVSWRIILRDLTEAYEAVAAGAQPFAQRAPAPSILAVTRALYELPETSAGEQASIRWHELEVAPDPPRSNASRGTRWHVARARVPEPVTRVLRTVMPQRHRVDMDDILVTAALRALRETTGRREHRIACEGHGRDDLPVAGVDEVVGWLTSYVPVRLIDRDGDWAARLVSVRSGLRQLPRPRALYGVLRYGGGSPLMLTHRPEIAINYLGELDDVASALVLGPPRIELAHSPDLPRHHALDVVAHIEDGCLVVTVTGDHTAYDDEQVDRIAELVARDVEEAAELVVAPRGSLSVPEDYGLVGVGVDDLSRAVGDADVSAVFPLTAMAQSMLIGTAMDPTGRLYVETMWFDVTGFGSSDVAVAWSRVVEEHVALRLRVRRRGLTNPLAIVENEHTPEVVRLDWAGVETGEIADRTRELVDDDRSRGIDPDTGALSRTTLVDLPGVGTRVIWTFHHCILDGWSTSTVLRDLRGALRGVDVPSGADYGAVAEAVVRAEADPALSYWRALLNGFAGPTPLPEGCDLAAAGSRGSTAKVSAALLGPDGGARLRSAAARSRCTVSTLLHAAWAVALGELSGSADVCFGTTVSGRSQLSGRQADVVGLLINTLPVRVRLARVTSWASLVEHLRHQTADHLEHEHDPLRSVVAAIGCPSGRPLFHTNLVFENYPGAGDDAECEPFLAPFDLTFETATNFPLTLAVTSDGPRCVLAVHHDPAVVSERCAVLVRRGVEHVLERTEFHPELSLADAIAGLRPERGEATAVQKDSNPVPPTTSPVPAASTGTEDVELFDAVRDTVRKCLAEVTTIPPTGDDDDLLARGLTSLDIMRLVARLERALGLDLLPSAVFLAPSIRGIVAHILAEFSAMAGQEEAR